MLQTATTASLGGGKQAKKLVIKNFKGQRLPDDFETNKWKVLHEGLQAIFSGRQDSISLEVLYRACEDMCRCRLAHPLYSRLYTECEMHAQSYAPRVLDVLSISNVSLASSAELLRKLNQLWIEYTSQVKMICNVFLYLDRVFVINRPELLSIREMSMVHFRTTAFGDPSIRLILIKNLLATIREDRQAEISQLSLLLASTIGMLYDLKLVDSWLSQEMLADTGSFYDAESHVRVSALDPASYLRYVRQRIDDEARRLVNYDVETSLRAELMQTVRTSLVITHLDAILSSGLETFICDESNDILCLTYGLCQETQSVSSLCSAWSAVIKSIAGRVIGSSTTKDETILGELIEFKDKLDRILTSCFENNSIFSEAEKETFESIMNSRQNRPAELVARYADYQLRGGIGEVQLPDQIGPILDKIIVFFRFLQGKDYFEMVFKRNLSRRLLFHRYISLDLERSFVARLKHECGSAFTSKLEGMFKDMELSKDSTAAYHEQRRKKRSLTAGSENRDFSCNIIASGLWPYPPLVPTAIPSAILREQEEFEEFYRTQHKGRVLTWHQGLGYCVLRANFPLGTKELQLSIPQALVLLQFNGDGDEKSFGRLRENTSLDEATLSRTLQSLACGKVNVLVKNPRGKEISPSDLFSFNSEFTSKHNRIRINATSPSEGGIGNGEGPEEGGGLPISPGAGEGPSDRQYQIDAAIVRLLKVHRQLPKHQLIGQISEQLKYSLGEEEFTKRSQSLIDREFICQDTDDSTVYKYLV